MSDVSINGITYPEPQWVEFPGKDGKPVRFVIPRPPEPVINRSSTNPPETRAVYEADEEIRQMIASPFDTGEAVADMAALNAIQNPAKNEAHYVISEGCRYGWTGTKWTQVSMKESKYADELTGLQSKMDGSMSQINYGYDMPYAQEEVPGGTWKTSLGITRNGPIVTLNRSTLPNGAVHVRLDGEVDLKSTNAQVDAWDSGISLIGGHRYVATVTLLSGSSYYDDEVGNRVPHCSVFPTGTHNTPGTLTYGDGWAKTMFTAEAGTTYNLSLYFPNQKYLFTNARLLVTLTDLDANMLYLEAEALVGKHAPALQNPHVAFYLRKPTFRVVGTTVTVTVPANVRYFYNNGSGGAASSAGSFEVEHGQYFVFDAEAKTFAAVDSPADFDSNTIVCFYNSQGQVVGQWAPYYFAGLKEEEQAVPSYYFDDDYLSGKVDDINTIGLGLGLQSWRAFFFTDYHLEGNAGRSPLLMEYLIGKTGIKNVVFGGDAYDKDAASKLGGYAKLTQFASAFSPLEAESSTFLITGNHEMNDPAASASELRLSRAAVYHVFNAPNRTITCLEGTNSFYLDDASVRIRAYFIDCDYASRITDDTIFAVMDSMLTVPEGYAVVMFSHVGLMPDPEDGANLVPDTRFEPILRGCKAMQDGESVRIAGITATGRAKTYDFTNHARTFIGAICGHLHTDGHFIYDGRFPVILTTCDTGAYRSTKPDRVANTITEQAFDVVQIDVAASRIYCTRIGYGEDRAFSFGSGAGLIEG